MQAISEKMKELDIQDCKVRVLNVDSQASFQNIVVQVIGEMSNKSEPHHRFVQTFVLAEQPNGYFVLNDIFRYLNDDEDQIVDDEPAPGTAIAQEEHSSPVAAAVETTKEAENYADEAAVEHVDAKLEEAAKEEQHDEAAGVNGTSTTSAPDPAPVAEETAEPTKEVYEDVTEADVTEPAPTAVADEKPVEPEPTPARGSPKQTEPVPAVDVPPAKKTWASLVGAKASTPAAAAPVSTPTATATATVAPIQPKPQRSPQPSAQPSSTTTETAAPTAPQGNGWQMADHGKKQNRPQAKSSADQNALAYIKNVTEKIHAGELRMELEKYGELKYFDVSRQRVRTSSPVEVEDLLLMILQNCAFVEFADAAGYNAAVAANPHTVTGEQIFVEERRPRPNAFGGSNAPFPRGGANTGRGRGGMPGRNGQQTGGLQSGRGNFQQRGAKSGSGNVTPRGRGQAQAV